MELVDVFSGTAFLFRTPRSKPALKNNIDPPTIILPYSVSLMLQIALFPFVGVI